MLADVATTPIMLLHARSLPHAVHHIGAGVQFTPADWCDKLRTAFPGLSCRLTDTVAAWTVTPLASVGRTPFAAQRIRADLGFAPRFLPDQAFEHYLAWWDAHPMRLRGFPGQGGAFRRSHRQAE